jgi:hypothetical protein
MDIQSYQATLNNLHNGFVICAVLTTIFFMAAILLFWRFGMFAIIRQRFGFEAKRSREEFKEQNEVTGVSKYHSVALGERTPRIQLKPKDAPGAAQAAEHASPGEPLPASSEPDEEPTPATTRLQSSEGPNENTPIAGFEVTKNILLIHTSRDTLVP